ncbi:ABC transporter substrate-binding protein [Natrarchaeobius sp. A-rgal3]|uniref:ABC transporter substrate-binding protein n=1 Tax=Natrarchaeobius versutus TaxID=1679078 RepID=UPI0035105F32
MRGCTMRYEAPTRRETITYGGAVVGSGLIAGCTGSEREDTRTSAPVSDENGETDDGREVCLEPVGCLEFEGPPERYVTYKESTAEMAILAGHGDGLAGIDRPTEGLATLDELFYDEIPGLSIDPAGITNIRADGENVDKEIFYEIDADLHLIDPNEAAFRFDWSDDDLAEIEEHVAPFFGHSNRRYTYDWQDGYEVIDLLDNFERIAAVFGATDRYEAFREVHDRMLERIDEVTPDEDPEIGLLNGGSDARTGTFYPLSPSSAGYEMRQYRTIGVTDAFADVDVGDGEADYETLLDVDPEIIVFHWDVLSSEEEFRTERLEPMRDHPVGGELTAVKNDRVYPGGTAEQGPLTNLFQTELLAAQLWPAEFGDVELFDRQRVAEIVTGEIDR